jgi:predicted nucleic acid-binding protein
VKYLLDTCALSELTKTQTNPGFLSWFEAQNGDDFYISVITLAEIEKGIQRLADSKKKRHLNDWLERIEVGFAERSKVFDIPLAKTWAKMTAMSESQGRRLPSFDSIIAATALKYDLVLVTRNEQDFIGLPIQILNPWS